MSATAAARIGGDLYEVISTPGGVRLILGDVLGKGLDAVRTANMVLGAYREAAYEAADLVEIAARIERSMSNQAPEQEFVTAVLAEIRPCAGEIEILSCGHPAPLLVREGAAEPAESLAPGLPLGLSSLGPGCRVSRTWPFGPGDQVLFYTDGISEARDQAGAFFPMSACGPILAGNDPEQALDFLRGQVERHVGHTLTDDAALLLVTGVPSDAALVPSQAGPADSARALGGVNG
jgi:serine phosphatase RsbU (regulator of sigma subunit)